MLAEPAQTGGGGEALLEEGAGVDVDSRWDRGASLDERRHVSQLLPEDPVIVLALGVARDDPEPRGGFGRRPSVVAQSAADEAESPFEAPGGVGASLRLRAPSTPSPVVAALEPSFRVSSDSGSRAGAKPIL
jgi:hypothetical protein